MPTWMADRVGPSGGVLATDIDVSWMTDGCPFEVCHHDVALDETPEGGFDVAHARLVLTHVRARRCAAINGGGASSPAAGC